ncbi:putative sulfate exporter family transporter [Propionimicrobium sp. PCR01-08-3]|uniref:YeiH family protein n=1 Tax=Propionimicrobium sp. PCR01-08-3 TaxID=3052086 RepID=UPI00255CE74F|nr:putative sulfate exporter family transporter [Propionimicrobium sp. PCR01-08-3]WIY82792.1 putative sulfate exporter family transporter [Propionimicrobium sp. PCR01-08-3]
MESAQPTGKSTIIWTALGVVVLLALGIAVHALTEWVPAATKGTGFGQIAKSIEFPVYAILVGFAANAILSVLGVRQKMSKAFRTEFLIKTGLVLLGASINFAVIAKAALPAIAQAFLLIAAVFLFTWWFSGLLGLDDKLRALLSSAISICGVSAAVAAAGAVQAKKEQLAYTASLVIVFAVPMIFLLPWASGLLGLSPAVTGAWIGGNIDTTAAVTAAGTMAGEQPLQIATIVKVTQNALLGVVAVALTMYFTVKSERAQGNTGIPKLGTLWRSFPKFVLGFLIASIAATVFASNVDPAIAEPAIGVANDLRTWFLILAFVSIGLEFSFGSLKEAGWKPVLVFAAATVVNLLVGLLLAVILWSGFSF